MLLRRNRSQAGFSMLELLVVVSLIAIMAAASLPGIMRYVRNYRIRGAATEVATALQQARLRAISNNVNLGVLFVALSNDSYRIVREDVPGRPPTPAPSLAGELLVAPLVAQQASPIYQLPQDVQFVTADCAELADAGFVASDKLALRFNRLGAVCRAGTSSPWGDACAAVDAGQPWFWDRNDANDVALCLREQRTGLTRSIIISPGGRVQTVQRVTEANQ